MTEDKAKTKWCPFARTLVTLDRSDTATPVAIGSANRFDGDKMTLCVGSGCMAWRWNAQVPKKPGEKMGDFRDPKNPRLWVTQVDAPEFRTGHCGLAGMP